MFSLKVREDDVVNVAEPALMVDELTPLTIDNCAVGLEVPMPRLPALSMVARVWLLVMKLRLVLLTEPRKVRPVWTAKNSFSVPFVAPYPVCDPPMKSVVLLPT